MGLGSATSATGTVEKLVRPKRARIGLDESAVPAESDSRAKTQTDGLSMFDGWSEPAPDAAEISSVGKSSTASSVVGDVNGDGIIDLGRFYPEKGLWQWEVSGDSQIKWFRFGTKGDIPTLLDNDGDGRADLVLYHPSDGSWSVLRSSDGRIVSYRHHPLKLPN